MTAPLDPSPQMTGALALETFELTKRFGAFTAMDNVSMKVAPGLAPCATLNALRTTSGIISGLRICDA